MVHVSSYFKPGFYSIRSNSRTIRTFDLAYRACSRLTAYDDQTMFWLILRTNLNPAPEPMVRIQNYTLYLKCSTCSSLNYCYILPQVRCPAVGEKYTPRKSEHIVSCPLDNCMFSASNLRNPQLLDKLTKELAVRKQPAVMVHANWMNGKDKKKAALSRSKLWLARQIHDESGNFTCNVPPGSALFTVGDAA